MAWTSRAFLNVFWRQLVAWLVFLHCEHFSSRSLDTCFDHTSETVETAACTSLLIWI
jgi:hypothetical protein